MCISLTYLMPSLPSTLYENSDLSREIVSGFYCYAVYTTKSISESLMAFEDL